MRMLNKNRKGVSEVVANVLIVLLVIVGIAVIWSVVKPTIDKSSQQIQSDCFTVQVEPVSCTAVTCSSYVASQSECENHGCTYTSTTNPVTCTGTNIKAVNVKRSPGAGTFENIELVFGDGSNTGVVPANPKVTQATLTELSTNTIYEQFPTTLTGTGQKTVNTVLRVNGNLCQVSTQPVNCA